MSYYEHDYPTRLDGALDGLETALRDRYQQSVYDAVKNQQPLPTRLVSDDHTDYWNHLTPEVAAHASVNYTTCAYLNWFLNGRNGKVQEITCDGAIDSTSTGGRPESIDCRIGELFAACEEWAYGDRRYIFDVLPPFALQALEPLERARNALVEMAGSFGADPGAGNDPVFTPAFQAQTVGADIGTIYTNGDTTTDWQIKWTGLAAESAAKGFFASTLPTLRSHGQLANGLSTLINERASIIQHYRDNSLNLIASATQALAATTETVTDHRPFWKTVQGVGMVMAISEAAAPAGAAITLIGWLGEQFVAETKDVSFAGEPGQIANGLYQEVLEMNGTLATAEQAYLDDAAGFRNSLNAVPSTFLELYDFTENKAY